MSEWKTYKLGEISDSCLGKMLDKKKNKGDFQPYLANFNVRWGSFDFSELNQMRFEPHEEERYGLNENDLIICEGGEPGRCAIWKNEVAGMKIQKALHRLRVHEPHDPKFLYYRFSLAGKIGELDKHFIGSTIKHLTGVSLKQVELQFPSPATQQKIAKVLSVLDAKIELNNRINAELEAMAKLLYDYWFVQFDFPITAAQATALGNPALQGKPYKSSGGPMQHNKTLKREIPEGWEAKSLLDLATFTNGIACQKYPPADANTLPVIKIREMRTGYDKGTETVTRSVPDKVIVERGEVLFSWSASLEVIIWPHETGALNQHIFKVTSDSHPKAYFYEVLRDYLAQFQRIAELRKTTMGHITRDHLEQSRFPMAPLDLAERFAEKSDKILATIQINHQQTQHLTQLRDWLLPMLMNGQVSVE